MMNRKKSRIIITGWAQELNDVENKKFDRIYSLAQDLSLIVIIYYVKSGSSSRSNQLIFLVLLYTPSIIS